MVGLMKVAGRAMVFLRSLGSLSADFEVATQGGLMAEALGAVLGGATEGFLLAHNLKMLKYDHFLG